MKNNTDRKNRPMKTDADGYRLVVRVFHVDSEGEAVHVAKVAADFHPDYGLKTRAVGSPDAVRDAADALDVAADIRRDSDPEHGPERDHDPDGAECCACCPRRTVTCPGCGKLHRRGVGL